MRAAAEAAAHAVNQAKAQAAATEASVAANAKAIKMAEHAQLELEAAEAAAASEEARVFAEARRLDLLWMLEASSCSDLATVRAAVTFCDQMGIESKRTCSSCRSCSSPPSTYRAALQDAWDARKRRRAGARRAARS